MKFCIDCKHFRRNFLDSPELGKCVGPQLKRTPVNNSVFAVRAYWERTEGQCGMEGKYFEQTEMAAPKTAWEQLANWLRQRL